MHRVILGIFAAWISATFAATAMLWVKSGTAAFQLQPAFAVILAAWLICVGLIALLMRRREGAMVGWMYAAASISALLSAVVFFVLFAYPFMVCIPIGMLAAAMLFHAVIRASRRSVPAE